MAMDWQPEGPAMLEEIQPKPGQPHTHTVIFLHGRGDTASNFLKGLTHNNTWTDSQARSPFDIFPTFRWIFPTAGLKPCARPNGPRVMSQWFDLWDAVSVEHEMLMQPGLKDSVERIRGLVAEEAARLGGRWDKIVLMGISQGGATSVHTLLNLAFPASYTGPKRLGAFVGVSCRLPFLGRNLQQTRSILGLQGVPQGNEVLVNTPMLLEHCADDQTVLVGSGKQLRDTLRAFGANVEWREYSEGGHWFKSPEGLQDWKAFLEKVLPRN
ncbi:hypothetical protein N0V93_008148 [Gnomoniopsis smithogilvyi]|uniref:Phospholipase/carboxylesterase/thioesterase domain-containing protein n=1 Tax=Gnomoniopsis smithogilvyi TaxID=1191159 RepID=A0A9W8YMD8_9PEZI|nr:hypothetical protein N0V93_008148 [Gnomoniopsis smithogilvyi]